MKKSINNVLNDFIDENEMIEDETQTKKKIINSRRDLVEKLDKTLVTEDGRQLLREHY